MDYLVAQGGGIRLSNVIFFMAETHRCHEEGACWCRRRPSYADKHLKNSSPRVIYLGLSDCRETIGVARKAKQYFIKWHYDLGRKISVASERKTAERRPILPVRMEMTGVPDIINNDAFGYESRLYIR